MTQLEVGQAVWGSKGESQGYISRVEAGKINLTAGTIVRLAEVVSISLTELVRPPPSP